MKVLALVGVLALAGCAATPATPVTLPADASVDYQLGGAYPPPAGVTVVVRDSTQQPEPGLYNICYVNGFQTQPGEVWLDALVLHDDSGGRLVDPKWPDENILDISTAGKRADAALQVNRRTDACAASGFAAVEFDNLDSFSRSEGALSLDDAAAFAGLLVHHAHELGLAAGQKNTPELGERGRDGVGFDFAIAEECAQFDECAAYTDVYGDRVINIEYADALERPFAEVCADASTPAATVLRDRFLVPLGDPDYVFERC